MIKVKLSWKEGMEIMSEAETMKKYSFVVIADTQIISRNHPEHFEKMVDWIVKSKQQEQIQFVLHVGDVCDNGADDEQQFQLAGAQLKRIVEAGLPLIAVPGNHDYDNWLEINRDLTMYNRYLGVEFYKDQSWFGGVFEQGKSENMYALLDIGKDRYIVLALEFGPRKAVMEWAEQILQQHADRQAVILTHSFLYIDGERTREGDNHHPRDYKGIGEACDGEEMWQHYLKRHKNVFAVFSGHHVPGNAAVRIDQGDGGNQVIQSFQNWQMKEEGGQGRVRLVTIDKTAGECLLQVYNPVAGKYEDGPGYNVVIPL